MRVPLFSQSLSYVYVIKKTLTKLKPLKESATFSISFLQAMLCDSSLGVPIDRHHFTQIPSKLKKKIFLQIYVLYM